MYHQLFGLKQCMQLLGMWVVRNRIYLQFILTDKRCGEIHASCDSCWEVSTKPPSLLNLTYIEKKLAPLLYVFPTLVCYTVSFIHGLASLDFLSYIIVAISTVVTCMLLHVFFHQIRKAIFVTCVVYIPTTTNSSRFSMTPTNRVW